MSFIDRLRDDSLNETLFGSLAQARAVLDAWRIDYDGVRPHSGLANRTPEEFRVQHIAVAAGRDNGRRPPALSSRRGMRPLVHGLVSGRRVSRAA